jgi:lipopolysaccharide/colanic/teichoic acid biosynthesis glycosyltransferase
MQPSLVVSSKLMQQVLTDGFVDSDLGHPAPGYQVSKRVFDIVLASLLLIVCLPVMLLIGVAVKLDSPGNIFYCQYRVGYRGKSFRMLKFRSMRPERRNRYIPIAFPDRRRALKVDGDPRITSVGRILRRTSLDELPQLVNIVRGEMSFVGPRPELPELVAQYRLPHYCRHMVVPGLTGWWQIHGRCLRTNECLPAEDLDYKLADDLFYLAHRSFGFDTRVLLLTVPVVISGRGAT